MKKDRRLEWFLACIVCVFVLSLATGCGEDETSPGLSASIVIKSVECSVVSVSQNGVELNIHATGTASGPEVTFFDVDPSPGQGRDPGGLNCGSWTSHETFDDVCVREAGNPEETSWTLDVNRIFRGAAIYTGSREVTALLIESGFLPRADSLSVSCQ